MAYTQVADPLLNSDKPIRSTDIKQMRDNQDDFDGRITALEDPSIRIASHFSRPIGPVAKIVDGAGAGASYTADPEWHVEVASDGDAFNGILQDSSADQHYIKFDPTSGGDHGLIAGKTGFYFDNRVKPIVCNIRLKMNATTAAAGWDAFYIGLGSDQATELWPTLNTEPSDGIYLTYSSDTEWVWKAGDAGVWTTGTPFTHGLDNTWFTLSITWVAASKTATCVVDGTTRETFTSADNIPAAKMVYPFAAFGSNVNNADNAWVDSIECYASGAITDLT